jgi:hypothetical protein
MLLMTKLSRSTEAGCSHTAYRTISTGLPSHTRPRRRFWKRENTIYEVNVVLIVELRADHISRWLQDPVLLQPVHVTACNYTYYYYYLLQRNYCTYSITYLSTLNFAYLISEFHTVALYNTVVLPTIFGLIHNQQLCLPPPTVIPDFLLLSLVIARRLPSKQVTVPHGCRLSIYVIRSIIFIKFPMPFYQTPFQASHVHPLPPRAQLPYLKVRTSAMLFLLTVRN